MTAHVFTYGSLMFPEVWTRVVSGRYQQDVAVARGYRRFAVRDESYPGMIEMSGAEVQGVVYFDVSPPDLAALDAFEGEDYQRVAIPLNLTDGAIVFAQTYLYLPVSGLTEQDWLPENFEMQRFLDTYCRARLGGESENQT